MSKDYILLVFQSLYAPCKTRTYRSNYVRINKFKNMVKECRKVKKEERLQKIKKEEKKEKLKDYRKSPAVAHHTFCMGLDSLVQLPITGIPFFKVLEFSAGSRSPRTT